ncbi:hypothetical protein D3C86_1905040 [compost metagenome]
MHIHTGAQHNFTGDIRCFRHLNNLAKNQLLDDVRGYFAASQHLPHHHFAQIDIRYSMKCRRLACKWRTQSADNGDAIALTGDKR